MLAEGKLERVSGAAADGTALLDSAGRLLRSAAREETVNPEASFVLAYDAARKACTALLAQQGLRTKASGHHVTTEEAVRAQFGGPFGAFGALRRRRSEIEYPRHPADDVTKSEAAEAIASSRSILEAADALLGQLTIYGAT
jgi:HEPN domain-containing protein